MHRRGPLQWGFAQHEWLAYQFVGRERFGHQCTRIQLPSGMADQLVQRAFDLMIDRHETLRTTFVRTPEGDPEQIVSPPVPATLAKYSLDLEEDVEELFWEMDKAPFDIAQEFPFRAARVGDTINLVLAHIAIDGWSAQLLAREFDEALAAIHAGRTPELPEVGPQPLDQALWERSDKGQWLGKAALTFWQEELARRPAGFFPVPVLPERVGYFEVTLFSPAAGVALRLMSATHSVSPNAVFAAAAAVVLAEMFGSDLIPMTTTWAARERTQARGVVGSLFRDLDFTLDLTDRPPLPVVVKQAYRRILRAGMHSQFDFVAFTEIATAVGAARGVVLRPGISVNFRPFDDTPTRVAEQPSDRAAWDALTARSEFSTIVIPPEQRNYELHIEATPTPDGLAVMASGSDGVFDEDGLRRFLRAVEAVLVCLVMDGDVTTTAIRTILADARVQPNADWVFTDHSWVNLRVVEELLGTHPHVRSARVSAGETGLLAHVTTIDANLRPTDLRRVVMSGLDWRMAAMCPARFEIHLDDPGSGPLLIAQGDGRPAHALAPADDAERALHHAVVVANGLSAPSMGDNYVVAGGALNRAPRVNDLLAEAGYDPLSYRDFLSPCDLAELARRLIRRAEP